MHTIKITEKGKGIHVFEPESSLLTFFQKDEIMVQNVNTYQHFLELVGTTYGLEMNQRTKGWDFSIYTKLGNGETVEISDGNIGYLLSDEGFNANKREKLGGVLMTFLFLTNREKHPYTGEYGYDFLVRRNTDKNRLSEDVESVFKTPDFIKKTNLWKNRIILQNEALEVLNDYWKINHSVSFEAFLNAMKMKISRLMILFSYCSEFLPLTISLMNLERSMGELEDSSNFCFPKLKEKLTNVDELTEVELSRYYHLSLVIYRNSVTLKKFITDFHHFKNKIRGTLMPYYELSNSEYQDSIGSLDLAMCLKLKNRGITESVASKVSKTYPNLTKYMQSLQISSEIAKKNYLETHETLTKKLCTPMSFLPQSCPSLRHDVASALPPSLMNRIISHTYHHFICLFVLDEHTTISSLQLHRSLNFQLLLSLYESEHLQSQKEEEKEKQKQQKQKQTQTQKKTETKKIKHDKSTLTQQNQKKKNQNQSSSEDKQDKSEEMERIKRKESELKYLREEYYGLKYGNSGVSPKHMVRMAEILGGLGAVGTERLAHSLLLRNHDNLQLAIDEYVIDQERKKERKSKSNLGFGIREQRVPNTFSHGNIGTQFQHQQPQMTQLGRGTGGFGGFMTPNKMRQTPTRNPDVFPKLQHLSSGGYNVNVQNLGFGQNQIQQQQNQQQQYFPNITSSPKTKTKTKNAPTPTPTPHEPPTNMNLNLNLSTSPSNTGIGIGMGMGRKEYKYAAVRFTNMLDTPNTSTPFGTVISPTKMFGQTMDKSDGVGSGERKMKFKQKNYESCDGCNLMIRGFMFRCYSVKMSRDIRFCEHCHSHRDQLAKHDLIRLFGEYRNVVNWGWRMEDFRDDKFSDDKMKEVMDKDLGELYSSNGCVDFCQRMGMVPKHYLNNLGMIVNAIWFAIRHLKKKNKGQFIWKDVPNRVKMYFQRKDNGDIF